MKRPREASCLRILVSAGQSLNTVDTLWDPIENNTCDAIEHAQSQAIHFNKNISDRHGVTESQM